MNDRKLQYPTFLVIGAGKSGTTSIYNYLKQHPEAYMCPVKEPDFFALEGQTPVDPKDDPDMLFYYPWAVYTLDDYQKLYDGITTEKAAGEASTMYLYKPDTHLRIKKYVPDVKMVAIFRDPVSRLYSRWLHLAREDRTPTETFEGVFDKSTLWWKRDDLVQEGFYYTHLSKYFDTFDRNQFKIFLMEDMLKEPDKFTQDLFSFLDIDPNFKPRTDIQYNESGFVKNKFKDKLIGQDSLIRKSIQAVAPKAYERMRNNPKMQKQVFSMRSKNLDRPKIDPETRKRLIEEVYKDEILKFQDLIGRDLSKWLI